MSKHQQPYYPARGKPPPAGPRRGTLSKGKPPDFTVWAIDPKTDEKGTVGAAWWNEGGEMTIKINPFTTLTATMMIKLYPVEKGQPVTDRVQVTMDETPAVPLEVPVNEHGEIPY